VATSNVVGASVATTAGVTMLDAEDAASVVGTFGAGMTGAMPSSVCLRSGLFVAGAADVGAEAGAGAEDARGGVEAGGAGVEGRGAGAGEAGGDAAAAAI
jgi:hypothetical protein